MLVAVAGGCWVVTAHRMQGMDMGPGTDLGGLGWFAVVWVTMMAAMMLPSLVADGAPAARRGPRRRPARSPRTVVFAAGYLLTWLGAGLLAYALIEAVALARSRVAGWDRAGPTSPAG